MGEATTKTVLGRKVAAGHENHQAKAMTVQKALRLSVAKVAEKMLDMPLAALGVSMSVIENQGLEEAFGEKNMLILLDGPHLQAGVAVVDASLAGALVQQQTTGVVRPETDETRTLTRTDAALVAPLLDGLLKRVASVVETEEEARIFSGFRFGAMAEDERLALMALEANEFHQIALSLDISRGARQSKLNILLPIMDEDLVLPDSPGIETDGAEVAKKPDMAGTVFKLEAELDMVLCKMRLPLNTLEALQAGQAIQLPPNSFPDVTVTGINGDSIGTGIVGQVEGQRAVQLARAPVYAESPKRRESDKAGLGLPEMTDIAGSDNLPADLSGPPPMDIGLPDTPDLPDVPASLQFDEPDLPDLPDMGGLPDLPPLDPIPELDDMPDLADLEDLPELPELKIA